MYASRCLFLVFCVVQYVLSRSLDWFEDPFKTVEVINKTLESSTIFKENTRYIDNFGTFVSEKEDPEKKSEKELLKEGDSLHDKKMPNKEFSRSSQDDLKFSEVKKEKQFNDSSTSSTILKKPQPQHLEESGLHEGPLIVLESGSSTPAITTKSGSSNFTKNVPVPVGVDDGRNIVDVPTRGCGEGAGRDSKGICRNKFRK